jgi:hypothetical protein
MTAWRTVFEELSRFTGGEIIHTGQSATRVQKRTRRGNRNLLDGISLLNTVLSSQKSDNVELENDPLLTKAILKNSGREEEEKSRLI